MNSLAGHTDQDTADTVEDAACKDCTADRLGWLVDKDRTAWMVQRIGCSGAGKDHKDHIEPSR
jgi:hypothetical protein